MLRQLNDKVFYYVRKPDLTEEAGIKMLAEAKKKTFFSRKMRASSLLRTTRFSKGVVTMIGSIKVRSEWEKGYGGGGAVTDLRC
jgi:hypothetical protein